MKTRGRNGQPEAISSDSSLPPPQLYSGATPAQVADDLAPLLDFQRHGLPLDQLKALLDQHLLPHLMRYDSPTFQSMFNAFPSDEAHLGAQMALATNQGVTNWQVSPGGAMLEELCGRALCDLFGLAPEADATFLYSGTYANQEALYLALHRHAQRSGFDLAELGMAGFEHPERLAVLISEDAHFSIKHAVRMLGLGEQSILRLPLDSQRRIDATATNAIVAELGDRRQIVCVVATAGTTSTGAVDPIDPLADLCERTGAWLHVDGAYGYAYQLVPEWAPRFDGHERADSITWDPHKQLGVPIPNSVLFVKERRDFARMALYSGYFNRADEAVPNPGLKSPPSTRPLSALPLVTAIRGRGLDGLIEDLRAPLVAMRGLADYLRDQPDFIIFHKPETGILCFRMIPSGVAEEDLDELQRALYQRILDSGERSVSTTMLDGKTVLRLVSVSPNITIDHLCETIDVLRLYTRQIDL